MLLYTTESFTLIELPFHAILSHTLGPLVSLTLWTFSHNTLLICLVFAIVTIF